VVAALGCGVWALIPLGRSDISLPEIGRVEPTITADDAEFDVDAFRAPLFAAPPRDAAAIAIATPPPPPPPPPPPAPPTRIQLLAILTDESGYRAMLYDPDTDAILVRNETDPLGRGVVTRITRSTVEFSEGAAARTLTLRGVGGLP